MSTVELLEISKRYRATHALDRVSADIAPGVTGLLGPNGAGKTTLLKIVATVLSQDGGSLRVFGLDPSRAAERRDIRRRLGYLPQDPGMYLGFSGFDLVDYVAVLKEHTERRARHDEVRRVLELVGMTTDMHKKIRRLSGGMRRRVALATALLGRPELLVLDEPAAGLDPDQQLRFREAMSTVAREHTVLISTHQTQDVAALCRTVIVIANGRVRYDGSPGGLAEVASGRVWLDDHPHPGAVRAWITADGGYRNIGDPPANATIATPTIEDGYLLLARELEAVQS
jgi:ABC-2 type transport system ATP-binding protein